MARCPSVGLLLFGLLASGRAFPDLQLLQWNPHWQCFAWNTNNCTAEASRVLPELLLETDIDFANIIEFDADLPLPESWSSIRSNRSCGKDIVDLVYNHVRWQPSGEVVSDCMERSPLDRPFVVQQFKNTNTSEEVIVIGAHFPHPASYVFSTMNEAQVLRDALQVYLRKTSVERVLLIADTNELVNVSSARIMRYLGVPEGPIVSTSLERTCCFDNGFPAPSTFDRIVANFGGHMETTVLFDPLPYWAKEVEDPNDPSSRKGAFHKAVTGTLSMSPGPPPPSPVNVVLIACVATAAVLVLAGVLASCCICWRRRRAAKMLDPQVASGATPEGACQGESRDVP